MVSLSSKFLFLEEFGPFMHLALEVLLMLVTAAEKLFVIALGK